MVKRLNKIAVVGVNGAGKSTFLKFSGESDRTNFGNMTIGATLKSATSASTPWNCLIQGRQSSKPCRIYAASQSVRYATLGAFLFSGDTVEKRIENISGGEEQVVLADSGRPVNFLILDEPTNHLDIRSREMLLETLKNFGGTIVLVSHDRHFLRLLVDRVFEVDHGEMRVYEGSYDYYLSKSHHAAGCR
jgi:ATP-binding cassette subfamily F protein 3